MSRYDTVETAYRNRIERGIPDWTKERQVPHYVAPEVIVPADAVPRGTPSLGSLTRAEEVARHLARSLHAKDVTPR